MLHVGGIGGAESFSDVLSTTTRKHSPLLGKWIVLALWGFGAICLAVEGFALGYRYPAGEGIRQPEGVYMAIIVAMTVSLANLYLIHLFFELEGIQRHLYVHRNQRVPGGGIVPYGPGEGIWRYVPCALHWKMGFISAII